MKTALITGATRGLGAALALALAPTHHIIAVGRTIGGLEELDDRIRTAGGQATLAPMDITVPEAMQQLCRSIHDRWGHLDLWVHPAIHAAPLAPTAHLADKDMDKSIAINLRATALTATANDAAASWCVAPDPAGMYTAGNTGTPGAANVACP